MDEFVCVTVVSKPGESEDEFSARLSTFWTSMLRRHREDFEKVYAETTDFERRRDTLMRDYACEADVVDFVLQQLGQADLDVEPVDRTDTYSKYEVVPPEWMQIEH